MQKIFKSFKQAEVFETARMYVAQAWVCAIVQTHLSTDGWHNNCQKSELAKGSEFIVLVPLQADDSWRSRCLRFRGSSTSRTLLQHSSRKLVLLIGLISLIVPKRLWRSFNLPLKNLFLAKVCGPRPQTKIHSKHLERSLVSTCA